MPRPRADPGEVKLKRQRRIQRYRAKPAVKERIREQNKVYRQKRKEQASLRLHSDPLAILTDAATQQRYLEAENDSENDGFDGSGFGNDGFDDGDSEDDEFSDDGFDETESMTTAAIITDVCRSSKRSRWTNCNQLNIRWEGRIIRLTVRQ
jgi:hypothetical protein